MRKKPFEKRIDEFTIAIKDSGKGKAGVTMNTHIIRGRDIPHYFYEGADIFVADLTGKIKEYEPYINSIEYFQQPFPYLPPNKVITFGFTVDSVKGKVVLTKLELEYYRIQDIEKMEYPFRGNFIELTNGFLVSGLTRNGMSGAPVFFGYNQNGIKRFVFAGVVSGHFDTLNKSLIVKAREVVGQIEIAIKKR